MLRTDLFDCVDLRGPTKRRHRYAQGEIMAEVTEEHRAKARAAINRSMNDPAGTYSERLEVNVARLPRWNA